MSAAVDRVAARLAAARVAAELTDRQIRAGELLLAALREWKDAGGRGHFVFTARDRAERDQAHADRLATLLPPHAA